MGRYRSRWRLSKYVGQEEGRPQAEYSTGINYYLYGHNAKIEAEYAYLVGSDFSNYGFGANRFWLQSQVQF